MDLSFRFDRWFERLPRSPTDVGRVERIVIRPRDEPQGARATPETVRVTPAGGIEGDKWVDTPAATPDDQISLINVHVVRDLAGGDERAPLSGDNLHVDLDLGQENLPPGTRLSIGSAVLEVSPNIHRPCAKFVERFGARAAKRVARATRIGRRGRGVLCRVLQAGEMHVGDEIRVRRAAVVKEAT